MARDDQQEEFETFTKSGLTGKVSYGGLFEKRPGGGFLEKQMS